VYYIITLLLLQHRRPVFGITEKTKSVDKNKQISISFNFLFWLIISSISYLFNLLNIFK